MAIQPFRSFFVIALLFTSFGIAETPPPEEIPPSENTAPAKTDNAPEEAKEPRTFWTVLNSVKEKMSKWTWAPPNEDTLKKKYDEALAAELQHEAKQKEYEANIKALEAENREYEKTLIQFNKDKEKLEDAEDQLNKKEDIFTIESDQRIRKLEQEERQRNATLSAWRENIVQDVSHAKMQRTFHDDPETCKNKIISEKKIHCSTFPLIEWTINANLPNFASQSNQYILHEPKYAQNVATLAGHSFWIEPFGIFSQFSKQEEYSAFDLTSIGFISGLSASVSEHFLLSLATGYWHTSMRTESKGASGNSLALGPALNYNAQYGYFGLAMWATGNFYSLHHTIPFKLEKQALTASPTSWDFSMRSIAGFHIPLVKNITASPSVALDYIQTFQQRYSVKDGSFKCYEANSFDADYLRLKIELALRQGFDLKGDLLIFPNLMIGWVLSKPQNSPDTPYSCKRAETEIPCTYYDDQQLSLGAKIDMMFRKGFAMNLGGHAYLLGSHQNIYMGSLRLEWTW